MVAEKPRNSRHKTERGYPPPIFPSHLRDTLENAGETLLKYVAGINADFILEITANQGHGTLVIVFLEEVHNTQLGIRPSALPFAHVLVRFKYIHNCDGERQALGEGDSGKFSKPVGPYQENQRQSRLPGPRWHPTA
jgi:hypothetical protein